jgi:small-conductance mechanosensitive channel
VNLPGLVFLAVLTIIARYILKLVRAFFAGIEAGAIRTARFEREWAWPTYRLLRTAIVVFAVIVGYPYIPGSGSEAFKGISILLGVILSLGSTSFISNIVAGYTMIYRRAFRVGDRICVDQMTGIVTEIGLMVTRLRSPKNEELVLPNSTVLSSLLTNYSKLAREQGLILHTAVGIGYETPWRQVEAMLLEAAARTEGLLREPVPFVLQTQLGDFAITHELNAYCHTPEAMPRLYAAMHRNILDVFNEYGVQIMTPAYEIDPEQPKVVPKEQWFAPPAAARK